jgi:hypothetical protein
VTDELAPDVDIEVGRYALRTFKVDFKRRELRSLTQGRHGPSEWAGGLCVAKCHYYGHQPPDPTCTCGVYGAVSLGGLKQFGVFARSLVAVFAAEGDTLLGDCGLRTAYARVVAYWAPSRGVQRICAKQCGGAKRYNKLDDMLAAYDLPRGDARWLGRGMTPSLWFWVFTAAALNDGELLFQRTVLHHQSDWLTVGLALATVITATMAAWHWFRWRRR